MTIEEFERRLRAAASAIEVESRRAIEYGAIAIETEAKREIGHHHPAAGQLPRWSRLKLATLSETRRLGYSPPDNPLLRTGALRGGIRHSVSPAEEEIEARVGFNDVVAVVQERGGGHVPAQSYLERAARRKKNEIVIQVSRAVAQAFGIR